MIEREGGPRRSAFRTGTRGSGSACRPSAFAPGCTYLTCAWLDLPGGTAATQEIGESFQQPCPPVDVSRRAAWNDLLRTEARHSRILGCVADASVDFTDAGKGRLPMARGVRHLRRLRGLNKFRGVSDI